MTFIEQRLELGLNYGASYGPRFNTAIATASNGVEQRRAIWSQPLITIQLGDRRVNQSELDYLLAFHASTKGAFAGFRIRDWSDYRSGLTAIGTGDGTAQTWQLVKRYTVAGVTVTRPITKPIDGTLTVYLDGVAVLSGWTCDYTTGVLSTELTGAIAVDFQFDVPVRFEQDKIDFTYEAGKGNRKLFTLAPLTCVELRIEPTIYPPLDAIPAEIVETFDLGYDFGTLGGPSYKTAIATNAAEFESRKSYWENAKGSWDVGDRALIRSELDYFIALFRCARGMAVPFYFKDWQDELSKKVRFAEDRISFRFDAFRSTDEEVIFNLGGVAISEILPIAINKYTIFIRYKEDSLDPFTDLFLSFYAASVESILLGERDTQAGGVGVTGFPSINWVTQSAAGDTLFIQVLIIDSNGVFRFLQQQDLVPPTFLESGTTPPQNWITCATILPGAGDLKLFEFVSLVWN